MPILFRHIAFMIVSVLSFNSCIFGALWIAQSQSIKKPKIDRINDMIILEDALQQNVILSGIDDGDTAMQKPISLGAQSSDSTIVGKPGIGYIFPQTTGTLRFTPVADAFGSVIITVRVSSGTVVGQNKIDTVKVPATVPWVATKVMFKAGDLLTADAVGQWKVNAGHPVTYGPDGYLNGGAISPSNYPLPGVIEGALVGRIGQMGNVFLVGSHCVKNIVETGELLLVTNDDLIGGGGGAGLTDNSGFVTVYIKHNDVSQADTAYVSFMVIVLPVNDPPSFIKGPDQNVFDDAGGQVVNPWATGIVAGPLNERYQGVEFRSRCDRPELFDQPPSIDKSGILTYTPRAGKAGKATISVVCVDNGGTQNGGIDSSKTQPFTITVIPRTIAFIVKALNPFDPCTTKIPKKLAIPALPFDYGTVITVDFLPENSTFFDLLGCKVILFDAEGNCLGKTNTGNQGDANILISRNSSPNPHFLIFWSGKNQNGRVVGSGTYRAVVIINGPDGFKRSEKVYLGVRRSIQ